MECQKGDKIKIGGTRNKWPKSDKVKSSKSSLKGWNRHEIFFTFHVLFFLFKFNFHLRIVIPTRFDVELDEEKHKII